MASGVVSERMSPRQGQELTDQPVVGLDAEGIQDLVQNHRTGLLLPLPEGQTSWATVLKHPFAPLFDTCAKKYAELLAKVVGNHSMRMEMGKKACTEGIRGFTWWDAMEQCVDGYREGLRMTLNTDSRAQVPDTRLSSGFGGSTIQPNCR